MQGAPKGGEPAALAASVTFGQAGDGPNEVVRPLAQTHDRPLHPPERGRCRLPALREALTGPIILPAPPRRVGLQQPRRALPDTCPAC